MTSTVLTGKRVLHDRPYLGGSRFGWNIVGILMGFLGLSLVVAWVLGSYFRLDVAAMISFRGNDGACSLPREGVGLHCWGDFAAIRFSALTSPPQGPEAVYPISSRILRIPFFAISSIGGFQASLFAFVIASAACVISPLVWAVQHTPWALKFVVVTAAGVATAPFLMVVDRGNVLGLIVPMLFLSLLGLVSEKPWIVTIAVVVAASVKPQFALLSVVLLALRHWRPAMTALGGSIAIVVVPYLVLGGKSLQGISDWLDAARGWSGTQPLSVGSPGNISLPRALYLVVHSGPWRDAPLLSTVTDSTYTATCWALLAVIVSILVYSGRHLPPLALGVCFLTISSLALPLTFAYYAVFMIPVIAIIFRLGLDDWPAKTLWDRVVPVLLSAALVLGLSPLLVPLGASLTPPVASLLPVLSTCFWAAFLGAVAIWGLLRMQEGATPS